MAQLRSHHFEHQEQSTTLTVISTNHQGFWLFVDDVLQNENPVHSICVRNFWPRTDHGFVASPCATYATRKPEHYAHTASSSTPSYATGYESRRL